MARTRKSETAEVVPLDEYIRQFVEAKRALREAEAIVAVASAALLDVMCQDRITGTVGDCKVTITRVEGQRINWLIDRLKSKLTPANWRRVRVESVDAKKVEALILAGVITEQSVDECREIIYIKPYLKLTERPALTDTEVLTRRETA